MGERYSPPRRGDEWILNTGVLIEKIVGTTSMARNGLSGVRLAGVACALGGCGDGRSSSAGGSAINAQAGSNGNGNGSSKNAAAHTLLIELDGATYAAVKSGIASSALPNLGKFLLDSACSGGVSGTLSQQPSLDTPSWPTVLTGTWADRHRSTRTRRTRRCTPVHCF